MKSEINNRKIKFGFGKDEQKLVNSQQINQEFKR